MSGQRHQLHGAIPAEGRANGESTREPKSFRVPSANEILKCGCAVRDASGVYEGGMIARSISALADVIASNVVMT